MSIPPPFAPLPVSGVVSLDKLRGVRVTSGGGAGVGGGGGGMGSKRWLL